MLITANKSLDLCAGLRERRLHLSCVIAAPEEARPNTLAFGLYQTLQELDGQGQLGLPELSEWQLQSLTGIAHLQATAASTSAPAHQQEEFVFQLHRYPGLSPSAATALLTKVAAPCAHIKCVLVHQLASKHDAAFARFLMSCGVCRGGRQSHKN